MRRYVRERVRLLSSEKFLPMHPHKHVCLLPSQLLKGNVERNGPLHPQE
jgi:hypothetical protein